MIVTRFAPSPTGHLHLGHAYSALFADNAAHSEGGQFLLRIEDIDPVRCKPQFIDDLKEDLHWLGLDWPEPVRQQSQHLNDYCAALDKLRGLNVIYPCFCTRAEVAAEAANAGQAPHTSDEGPIYPGTCRALSETARAERLTAGAANWRLDSGKVKDLIGPLAWHDRKRGIMTADLNQFGDIVIARKDVPTSYHLSVTVDDHLQGITLVTRGEDLVPATSIQRYLQALLGLNVPEYEHHGIMKNAEGKRLAKRDKAQTLQSLRAAKKSPGEISKMVGFG